MGSTANQHYGTDPPGSLEVDKRSALGFSRTIARGNSSLKRRISLRHSHTPVTDTRVVGQGAPSMILYHWAGLLPWPAGPFL